MPPYTPPPVTLLSEVGEKIRQRKKALGISTEELAELCDTSIQTIKDVQNGKRTCSSYTFHRMMKALALSPDSIWGTPENVDCEMTALIALLSVDEQKFIEEMILGCLAGRRRLEKCKEKVLT